ncbi:hypothetical protein EDD15DRAFT_2376913 [Pisolithus albus]|nr:hypothetical protein EDD15DRAFT_2376913 [Pisolithus albus]
MDPTTSTPIDPALLAKSEVLVSTCNPSTPAHKAHDSYAAYELAGKKMACLINPYFSACTALKVGLMDSHGRYDDIPMDPSDIERYLDIYNHMLCYYSVYDSENRQLGLFCGHITWWFYVHLFVGPSAAAKGTITSNASKKAKNRAWGLMEVTLHIIAYVHVVAYFTLSSEQKWASTTGNVNLLEMAWMIIDMFGDRDEWTHVRFSRMLTKHGSAVGSNTSSTSTSQPSSVAPSNDILSAASTTSNVTNNTSKLSSTSNNIDPNSSTLPTENRDVSPLTSDEEMEMPVPVSVHPHRPVLKKHKKADEMIFATDTEDPLVSTTVKTAKATGHNTCQCKGRKHANGF